MFARSLSFAHNFRTTFRSLVRSLLFDGLAVHHITLSRFYFRSLSIFLSLSFKITLSICNWIDLVKICLCLFGFQKIYST